MLTFSPLIRSVLSRHLVAAAVLFYCLAAFGNDIYPQRLSIWRVKSPTGTVYLAGSIHVLRSSDHPIPFLFDHLFNAADQVAFEIDIDNAKSGPVQQYYTSKATYQDGGNIKNDLSPATYTALQDFCREYGLPTTHFDHLRPWAAEGLMEKMVSERLGFYSVNGIDPVLYERAKQVGKPRLALETAQFQIDLLSSPSAAVQNSSLYGSLVTRNQAGSFFSRLVDVWRNGRVEELAQIIASQPDNEQMLYSRNRNWIPQIENYLTQSKTTLVVVGAAHLAGPSSVVELLQQRGWIVEQLPIAPKITQQPQGKTMNIGQPIVMQASVDSVAPVQYEWTVNGTVISTAQELNFTPTSSGSVVAKMGHPSVGFVYSEPAYYTVITMAPPEFVVLPTSVAEAGIRSTITLRGEATGEQVTYQWFKVIPGGGYMPIPWATNNTYTIASISINDAAIYVLRASNPAGSRETPPVTISVRTQITVPQIVHVRKTGEMDLQFQTEPNRTYYLEGSNDLKTWGEIRAIPSGPGGTVSVTEPIRSRNQRFYFRVRT